MLSLKETSLLPTGSFQNCACNITRVVTWCRPHPWKAARESCTHVFARSRTLISPAPLPCRPYKLRLAAADARTSRCTESSRCGSLLPPPLRGASALLPPPLSRSYCEPWSAACGRRDPRAGGPARGRRMLTSHQPARHWLRSVCELYESPYRCLDASASQPPYRSI